MAGTAITVVGNLTGDPELRFTTDGTACTVLTVAVNARVFDKTAQAWKDGATSFFRVTAWRFLAENVAESLQKGARVIVSGDLAQRHWEDSEGKPQSAWGLTAFAIGPDLTYAQATVRKMARTGRTNPGDVAPDDPWQTATPGRPESAESAEAPF